MGNIIIFDPVYYQYLKMWQEDRWKFSSKMVNLTIKSNNNGVDEEEQHILDILNRIVEEHNGQWLDKPMPKKIRKKG